VISYPNITPQEILTPIYLKINPITFSVSSLMVKGFHNALYGIMHNDIFSYNDR
jgi:hypothetical protein